MEIVIDVPEYIYKLCQGHGDIVYKYIAKGVPIPKGHGRLKDIDAIMQELSVVSSRPVKSQIYIIDQAPTVVEADKAGEGE